MNLYDSLLKYKDEGYYPMHMPGHKRNTELLTMVNPYSIDITEIEGFDNLHRAEGILKEGMESWAKIYGSKETYYLVGGSSAGILAGISACTDRGDKILVARNCHKSVYNAIYLKGLRPVYFYPGRIKSVGINGSIPPGEIEEYLKKEKDIKLIVITSPTYEGIVSDVAGIAEAAHRYGIPLMVDEAHGAHLGLFSGFLQGSVTQGADIVVHSIHKTLPAFTQSALLHANGGLIKREKLIRYLSIYQSTSPSYLLMAGMDKCRELLENRGKELFSVYYSRLAEFYLAAEKFKNIRILTDNIVKTEGSYAFDPSKLVLSVKGTGSTGKELYDELLGSYKIQMEMVSGDYVLGMTSIADRKEGFDRLLEALSKIDDQLAGNGKEKQEEEEMEFTPPPVAMSCEEALDSPVRSIPLKGSEGRISAEYIYLYPPGIPLLVPGEKVTENLLSKMAVYKKQGLTIQGMDDLNADRIKVVEEGLKI
ncbi:aminotransferase class I/II-fold pyridoxal phosphate-dependent enzyme [Anaerocolumna xylanovorans]|uniref:Arginine/lysine/ornithine decarboxylase n=1 Tax=Anaerocolumna xylanovorans DSM 12503 TaxID=1121345 RepID=A0A1M7YKH9_9FIRM|nr:aminotransferase class I/II-fold pyridoxal phosphate-dependent enzyme [Anaerocolumna xylanovorans]SHO53107.1 Arginine/lysine/ornithine decarboxylase [Anaerocolumna xylanovorans DSM 12503]